MTNESVDLSKAPHFSDNPENRRYQGPQVELNDGWFSTGAPLVAVTNERITIEMSQPEYNV